MDRQDCVVRLGWGGVLVVVLLLVSACGNADPQVDAEHGSGADHDAEMARDADALLEQRLAEAAGKPPVIELEEVIRRTEADSATAARLVPRVAALNAALVRLVDLTGLTIQRRLSTRSIGSMGRPTRFTWKPTPMRTRSTVS